jgi:hypothetical protein
MIFSLLLTFIMLTFMCSYDVLYTFVLGAVCDYVCVNIYLL